MKSLYILFFSTLSLILSIRCESQINISGLVVDSLKKPIIGANLTLHINNSSLISAFAISDGKGYFTITYKSLKTTDTLFVKANAIGYAAKTVQITSVNNQLVFVLNTSSTQLPNVTVQNLKPFLKYKSDTLSYNVDSFTQKQDRTIGDVLKKMPGIEVDANGRISYNGRVISNFYIDGDDLLDDRYNIATNSIAANMVKDIQVLENHQPIKVLKNTTISDKVAINLSLKDAARLKLTSRVEAGTGMASDDGFIYDGNINMMLFKNKFKAINAIKGSNAGKDLGQDLISHNLADYYKSIENNIPTNTLSLNNPGNFNIGNQRNLFNKPISINTNNLFKTKKEIQVKNNFYYLYDNQIQNFTNNSFFYLPNDTIRYLQQQNTAYRINLLRGQLNINCNKESTYWNNTLVVEYNKLPSASTTNLNGVISQQDLLQQTTTLSNEFNYIQTTKNKSNILWYSYLGYLNKPELLEINPGINEVFFNSNMPYKRLIQQINIPSVYTNNHISFKQGKNNFLYSYQFGFSIQLQNLNSNTSKQLFDNNIFTISDSFINNIQWRNKKIFTNFNVDYLGERLKVSVSFPLTYQNIFYDNTAIKNNNYNFNAIVINPALNVRYAIGKESLLNGNYTFKNNFATIQDVVANYILSNYNQLLITNVPFKQSNIHSLGINYNYRKTIKILFINAGFLYNRIYNNSIYNTQFNPFIQIQNNELNNNAINSYSMFFGVSKYVFKLHTTFCIKANVRKSDWLQMQNGILTGFLNDNYNLIASMTPQINKWLNMAYTGSFMLNTSKQKNNSNNKRNVTSIQHTIETNIFLLENFYFKLKGENFFVRQENMNLNNYFFADFSATYKANKIKTDFVLDILNIANTKSFSTANVSANNLTQSSLSIRPRMIILKAFFNL